MDRDKDGTSWRVVIADHPGSSTAPDVGEEEVQARVEGSNTARTLRERREQAMLQAMIRIILGHPDDELVLRRTDTRVEECRCSICMRQLFTDDALILAGLGWMVLKDDDGEDS
jgi:hypothetical protein